VRLKSPVLHYLVKEAAHLLIIGIRNTLINFWLCLVHLNKVEASKATAFDIQLTLRLNIDFNSKIVDLLRMKLSQILGFV
jgi:hypothetical protein